MTSPVASPSAPSEMLPVLVTTNEISTLLSDSTQGSSPPAALATVSRIVAMAATSAFATSHPTARVVQFGRDELDIDGVGVLRGHLRPDTDLRPDDRDPEV